MSYDIEEDDLLNEENYDNFDVADLINVEEGSGFKKILIIIAVIIIIIIIIGIVIYFSKANNIKNENCKYKDYPKQTNLNCGDLTVNSCKNACKAKQTNGICKKDDKCNGNYSVNLSKCTCDNSVNVTKYIDECYDNDYTDDRNKNIKKCYKKCENNKAAIINDEIVCIPPNIINPNPVPVYDCPEELVDQDENGCLALKTNDFSCITNGPDNERYAYINNFKCEYSRIDKCLNNDDYKLENNNEIIGCYRKCPDNYTVEVIKNKVYCKPKK